MKAPRLIKQRNEIEAKMDTTDRQSETRREDARTLFPRLGKPLVNEVLKHRMHGHATVEDLHALRVALRRMRTLLWAWRPLLDRDAVERDRAFLRRVAAAAGGARDWDIAMTLVDTEDREFQGERVDAARRKARKSAETTLSAADLKHTLPDILNAVKSGLKTGRASMPATRFARKRVLAAREALGKRIRRARKADKREYDAWHDVRKGAKKLRYLLEFFSPMASHGYKGKLRSLKKIQKKFGLLNDAVATERLLTNHRDVFVNDAAAQAALTKLHKECRRRQRAASNMLG
ncbi:CHAD domain-containing protein [Paraburkholderia pallida]|uniref:CHAD domain-containing protein n=1 Tax=Paraburkholderia pallida TaxID=2547399 RepID=A0A4P7CY86_9BURK|nr:CHAD domain-containing protein [Paraburkholderia pallida]QBQ99091.1 CHAD domain-containing protein [Paraburkholderia pallida]